MVARIVRKLKLMFTDPKLPQIMGNSLVSSDTQVGNYSYIGYNCCVTRASIARYVSIANNVSIGQGEHDYRLISTSSFFYKNPYEKLTAGNCVIGNDVWIGVDTIIRRGVTIGDGAVIGANSFVNSDIPDFAIAVGNPAKVIKYRFNENKIKKIKASRWWDKDLDSAKLIIDQLEREIDG